jgi:acetoin utilization protein AcuC
VRPLATAPRRHAARCRGSVAGDIAVGVEECPVSDSVAVVWDDALLGYTMGGDHPLHPVRLDLTMRLADGLGVLATDRLQVLRPTPADVDLLTRVHDPAYLEAVKRAPADPASATASGRRTTRSSRACTTPRADHRGQRARRRAGAQRPGAARGQHLRRAAPRDARPRVGLLRLQRRRGGHPVAAGPGHERIAYVDLDVHHGDGVQAVFYDDPRVLTVSIHQTPLTLFPGTGFPEETGDADKALGSAVNLALPNGTDDSGWLRAFHAVVPSVLRRSSRRSW